MDLQFFEDNAVIILLIALWDLAWKGFAMWRAAHKSSKLWFTALLVINSAGIVPILYLLITGGLTLTPAATDAATTDDDK